MDTHSSRVEVAADSSVSNLVIMNEDHYGNMIPYRELRRTMGPYTLFRPSIDLNSCATKISHGDIQNEINPMGEFGRCHYSKTNKGHIWDGNGRQC
jgi:hypothetical protein